MGGEAEGGEEFWKWGNWCRVVMEIGIRPIKGTQVGEEWTSIIKRARMEDQSGILGRIAENEGHIIGRVEWGREGRLVWAC